MGHLGAFAYFPFEPERVAILAKTFSTFPFFLGQPKVHVHSLIFMHNKLPSVTEVCPFESVVPAC